MSETGGKSLVPALRFPEFRTSSDWNIDKFCDLFQNLSNNTLSRSELSNGKGNVHNIHYGDILVKFNECLDVAKENLPHITDIIKADKYKASYLKDGDIVMADTAEDETAGKCTEVINVGNTIVVAGLHTIPCRPRKEFAQAYLGYFMNSKVFHDRLLPIMQGAKVTSIPKSSLQSIPLAYPKTKGEQQKIADCLSSLDAGINAMKEKIEQLKIHRKGLMQKLFPDAGKLVPALRFPEFMKAGEWDDKRLGNCLVEPPAYGLNAPSVPYSPLLPTYLRITDISENGRFISESKVSVEATLTDENSLHDGDIVLARTGASVGKSYKYRKDDGHLIFAGFLIRIKPNATRYDSEFIFQYLQTDVYKKWVNITSVRSGQPGINSNEYASLPIPCPSPDEQKKIAECLSSLDELIGSYERKVTLLEQHKKGLMQQLFPKL